jgi:hypothetical protein
VPKVAIGSLDTAPVSDLPQNVASEGSVEARSLIAHNSSTLHLHYLTLNPGSSVTWTQPASDFCVYVLNGQVEVNGTPLDERGCFVVEHGGDAQVTSAKGATLAMFQDRNPTARKPGGHVHLIRHEDVPNNSGEDHGDLADSSLIADATCPTCDMWLHGNLFPEGNSVGLHSHSEDEIILITSGEIVLGARRFGPNTAVAVGKDAMYQFTAGSGGMGFVNFRAGSPSAKHPGDDKLMDEGGFFRGKFGSPKHSPAEAA